MSVCGLPVEDSQSLDADIYRDIILVFKSDRAITAYVVKA
jgi:hypothetical protein